MDTAKSQAFCRFGAAIKDARLRKEFSLRNREIRVRILGSEVDKDFDASRISLQAR
jgi:hypothetical protein